MSDSKLPEWLKEYRAGTPQSHIRECLMNEWERSLLGLPSFCICEQLRVCEARVQKETLTNTAHSKTRQP